MWDTWRVASRLLVRARETDPEARRDFFGSGKAKQAIVCALMQGPEEDYAKGEAIAEAKVQIFQPDWKKVFEPKSLRKSVAKITGKLPR